MKTKKYIILAVIAVVLGTAVYGFSTSQKTADKCNCSETEVCSCTNTCECSACSS